MNDLQRKFNAEFDLPTQKTVWHFFNWAAKGDEKVRADYIARFERSCKRAGKRRTIANACEWLERARAREKRS